MTTYRDVKAQIAKLENQARELLKKESAGVVAKIRGMMSEYGLTVQDLGLGITRMGKKMTAMKQPLPPKYRDPLSGATWSGKGKAPGWIAAAAKEGRKDDFLIVRPAATTEVKKAAPAKKTAPKKSVTAKPATAKKPAVKKAAVSKPVAKVAAKKPADSKTAAKPVTKPAEKKVAAPRKTVARAKPAPKAPSAPPAAAEDSKV